MATITAEPPTKENLLIESAKLLEEKKYQEIINLLDDETLTRLNNADLYINKAEALDALGNESESLRLADLAIVADNKNATAYNFRGTLWYAKKDFDKAISDYSEAIRLQPNYATAFYNRGLAWLNKNEKDNALGDFQVATQFNPNDSEAYFNLGAILAEKKEYTRALEAYNKVIELLPNDSGAYNNRGLIWYTLQDYDKAIEDYTRAIDANPQSPYPYNNRGVVYAAKKEYENAIEDYDSAAKADPSYPNPHRNMGEAYSEMGKFDDAIKAFEKAMSLDPTYTWLQSSIDELKAKMQKIDEIKVEENRPAGNSLYYLVKTIDTLNISEIDKKLLKETGNLLLQTLNKIRDYSFADNKDPVVHYTKLKVADLLVSQKKEPQLRYYNVIYMNDPEEGETIFDCLDDKEIEECFKSGREVQDNNIYLGSFLPAKENDKNNNHADELVMWRTYGKDENKNDAAGCSIVILPEFFGSDKHYLHSDMSDRGDGDKSEKAKPVSNQALYSVLYFNKRDKKLLDPKGKDLNKLVTELKTTIRAFISQKTISAASPEKSLAINKIIYRFLTEIRYLFKSSDYAFENELRVIQYALPSSNIKDNLVKVDDNGGLSLPRRLYIESNKPVRQYISKIYLGPKVPNPQIWMYLETTMKMKGYNKMELKISETKFQ